MIREKVEILPTLRVSDNDDENTIQLTEEIQVTIIEIKDIMTIYGKRPLAIVEDNEGKKYQVFVNNSSMNNLIDAFGNDDEDFKGKICNLTKKIAYNGKEMIVFEPISA